MRPSSTALMAAFAALMVAMPLLGVVLAAMGPDSADIAGKDIARYAGTSLGLGLLVGIFTAIIGTAAAWLIVMRDFPMRRFFAWALAMPLAAPAFALAYGYSDLLDVGGVFRIWLRETVGHDLPFELRTVSGAAFILSAAFYPYVYLAMRAAFINQSVNVLEAAQILGCNRRDTLFRVALPMARPALVAGVALAVMETFADYGAVQFLSVQTLTTGVVRAWSVYGSTASAARFALPLLGAAALLLWMERASRQGKVHESAKARWRSVEAVPLGRMGQIFAVLFCTGLLTLSLFIPIGWLVYKMTQASPDWPCLIDAFKNTVFLGAAGAFVTVALATMLAIGTRNLPLAGRIASLGYATPGAVMAIGLLAPAGIIWNVLPSSGVGIALTLLILAYAARLMAAALEPIDAGLARVTPAMRHAARNLGRGELNAVWSVELPVARGAIFTALLVIFVDILKELPATLILRPFNFDTLAVIANNYAQDERLGQAGAPSLMIIAIALPAVIWLTGRIALTRPGNSPPSSANLLQDKA